MGSILRIKPNIIKPKAIIVAEGMGGRFAGLTTLVHKGILPVAGRSNVEWLVKKLIEYQVKDVYIATHHRPQDIKNEIGYGEKFGGALNIHYNFETKLNNTASAANNIIFGKYKTDFKDDEYVWVFACDVGFPGADLGAFKQSFLEAVAKGGKGRDGKPKIVGGIGFVVRPYEDFYRRRPTAVINSENLITKWYFNPITNYSEGETIRKQIGSKNVREFEKTTRLHGLPFPTFFYILSRDAFEAMARIKDREQSDIDFIVHLFKLFPNRLWAHFFKEESLIPGALSRQYYDFNTPVDYYRAQWQFIKTASKLMTDTHTYFPTVNSFLGLDLLGVNMERKNVINCVVDDYVQLMDNVRCRNSIIGQRCIINNAIINNSIILPNTFINYHPSKDEEQAEIINSIVGGGGQFPTFFDTLHSKSMSIEGAFAVPDSRMQLMISDLGISEADVKMCEQAFEVTQNTNKKKE